MERLLAGRRWVSEVKQVKLAALLLSRRSRLFQRLGPHLSLRLEMLLRVCTPRFDLDIVEVEAEVSAFALLLSMRLC